MALYRGLSGKSEVYRISRRSEEPSGNSFSVLMGSR